MDHIYIAIDLKSFYASVECMERGLDPLATNLVVADESRTEKTICLAVSPTLKEIGIPGRPRLFDVVQKVKAANRQRQQSAPRGKLTSASCNSVELKANPSLAIDYIVAKHIPADKDGVRIAELDERSYRQQLWEHRPLTDFWRIGRGYARKLEARGLYTMGDIARYSLLDEDGLYAMFGKNTELLIDHAWGWEPCTIADIKAYKPASNSLSSGQVLQNAYDFTKARLVVREMTDALVLELVEKHLVTDQMELTIGYDIENLSDPERKRNYAGPVETDHYGRQAPKAAHGSINLRRQTSSSKRITDAVMELYDRIVHPELLVRRMYVVANHLIDEGDVRPEAPQQLDMFTDYEAERQRQEAEEAALEKERRGQHAILEIKSKYGKNAILRGMNLLEGATAKDRNQQIGGHKA